MPKQFRTIGKKLFATFTGRADDRGSKQMAPSLAASIDGVVEAVVEALETRQLLSVPNGPFGAGATASTTGVNVTWYDNSNDETGFRVERKTGANGTYATVATLGVNATSFWDPSVSGATTYEYRIRAFNAGGDSGTTETNLITTPTTGGFTGGTAGQSATTVPNGPWSLLASATSASSVTLRWTSNSNNEAGFTIERKAWNGNYAVVGTTSAGITSWTDTSVSGSTQYTYRVKAYNNVGSSSYSNEAAATTPAGATTTPPPTPPPTTGGTATTVPNGPWSLAATATSANSVGLTWADNSTNESGFTIERKAWNGNYSVVATVGAGATAWTDTTTSGSTQYTYRVKAFNNIGDSAYSNESATTTPAGGATTPPPTGGGTATSVPNGPWGMQAVAGSNFINVSWTDYSTNESGFIVERKTSGGSYSTVATLGADVTSWSDTSIASGTTYTYHVKAYNNVGSSAYSNEASATSNGAGAGGGTTGGPTAAWTAAETSGYFTIGTYSQSTNTFGTWKARGINTVVGFNTNQTWMQMWIAAAQQYGMMEIRNPQANIAADKSDPNLLAYEHGDEPDVNGTPLSTLQSEYAQWKAANPNVPVLVNVAGATVIGQLDTTTDQDYKNMFATADWISNDIYPVGVWGQPSWIDKTMSNSNPWGITDKLNEGNAVDKIRSLTGGKHQFAYVETSWQRLVQINSGTSRQPTAQEVRGEIWNSVIHGAKGVIYFPQAFNPDTGDATPPDVAAELTSTDAKLTNFAKALNNIGDSQSNYIDLGGGLEGTYRDYNGHRYFFVLNFSHTATTQKFTLPGVGSQNVEVAGEGRSVWAGSGAITDSFGQYDVHVYRV